MKTPALQKYLRTLPVAAPCEQGGSPAVHPIHRQLRWASVYYTSPSPATCCSRARWGVGLPLPGFGVAVSIHSCRWEFKGGKQGDHREEQPTPPNWSGDFRIPQPHRFAQGESKPVWSVPCHLLHRFVPEVGVTLALPRVTPCRLSLELRHHPSGVPHRVIMSHSV